MVEANDVNFYDFVIRVEPRTIRHDDRPETTQEQEQARLENRLPSLMKTWEQLSRPRPFFLTGDTTMFVLSIKNGKNWKRSGKIAFHLRLGSEYINQYFFDFEVEPLGTWKRMFAQVHHLNEGFFEISVVDVGTPESWAGTPKGEFEQFVMQAGFSRIPATTYTVKDRGVYEDEQKRHQEMVQKLDRMPEVILTEVDRRIAQAIQDPKFVAEVAKAKLEIEREEQEKAQKTQQKADAKESGVYQ